MAERSENFLTTADLKDKLRDKHKSEPDIESALEQVEQASENVDEQEVLQEKQTQEVKDFYERFKTDPNTTMPGFSEAQLEQLDRLEKQEQKDKHQKAVEDADLEYSRYRKTPVGEFFEKNENLSPEADEIFENYLKADILSPPAFTDSGDTVREPPTTRNLNESKE